MLYRFTGGSDVARPATRLAIDASGVLYGVCDGVSYMPTVFALSPPSSPGGAWSEQTIFQFTQAITSGLVVSPDGALYGVAGETAFSLRPSGLPGVPWTYAVLCTNFLAIGTIAVGPGGALYGFGEGGAYDHGTVLSIDLPTSPGGACTDTILYSFALVKSGYNPSGGVVMGVRGALYGETLDSSQDHETCGSVYSLEPPASPGGAWTYRPLYVFSC